MAVRDVDENAHTRGSYEWLWSEYKEELPGVVGKKKPAGRTGGLVLNLICLIR